MASDYKPWGMEENTFLLLLHLSILAGFAIPIVGIVLPIIMWATNKDHSQAVDRHGKVILNWMLSCLIYFIVSFVLIFLFYIGFIGIFALAVLNVAFAIIGAIKANDGVFWVYPLSIEFLKIDESNSQVIDKDR